VSLSISGAKFMGLVKMDISLCENGWLLIESELSLQLTSLAGYIIEKEPILALAQSQFRPALR
jgi:hypothetical protein